MEEPLQNGAECVRLFHDLAVNLQSIQSIRLTLLTSQNGVMQWTQSVDIAQFLVIVLETEQTER